MKDKDNFPHLDLIGIVLGLASWLLPSVHWTLKIIISIIVIFGAYYLRNKSAQPSRLKKQSSTISSKDSASLTSQEKDTAVINLDSVINPISNAMGGCATIIFAISSPILLSFLFFIFAGILQIKQMYFGASTELTQLITDSGGKMTWLHGLVVAIPIAIYGFVFRYKSSKEAGCSTVFISLGYQATLIYLFYNSPFFFSDNLLFRLGVIFHPLIFVAPDLSVNNLLCNILYVIEIGMVLLLDYWYFHIGYSIADSLKKKKENKDKDSESTIETAT